MIGSSCTGAFARLRGQRRAALERAGQQHVPLRLEEIRIAGNDLEGELRREMLAHELAFARLPKRARRRIGAGDAARGVQEQHRAEILRGLAIPPLRADAGR